MFLYILTVQLFGLSNVHIQVSIEIYKKGEIKIEHLFTVKLFSNFKLFRGCTITKRVTDVTT